MARKRSGEPVSAVIGLVSDMLRRISSRRRQLTLLQAEADEKIRPILEQYEPGISELKQELADLDAALRAMCARSEAELFASGDRVAAPGGVVIRTVKPWVVRIRGIVEALKHAGRHDLIRVAESADWDAVSGLDDNALAAIGTRREKKSEFTYEVDG